MNLLIQDIRDKKVWLYNEKLWYNDLGETYSGRGAEEWITTSLLPGLDPNFRLLSKVFML